MDKNIENLIKNRNKMVYAICVISVSLLIMAITKYFIYFHVGYFLILVVPFLALTYSMIGLTEKIKDLRHSVDETAHTGDLEAVNEDLNND